ncbi:hypothetical protein T265_10891 [Opisthorchis viverrini]|uniref:Uncharacterized protein n=1 Tax=Opisthorchis viverrini TaxID=6198 RepID=A0A074Z0M0_OPIVI|nr:hypothetical protein T265_10891 [Opisthorchis viverrini]KER20591.1 hypothetical protein T265_10891 [Opisthorchis viverrini]
MTLRMVTKRLQVNCQARSTDHQPVADSLQMLYKRTQADLRHPPNCALMMSPRMVADSLQMLYKRTQADLRHPPNCALMMSPRMARKKYPLNCALMMSPRMVTKRLQANCQARRTDQQPPDQQPINSPELPIFQQITKPQVCLFFGVF